MAFFIPAPIGATKISWRYAIALLAARYANAAWRYADFNVSVSAAPNPDATLILAAHDW